MMREDNSQASQQQQQRPWWFKWGQKIACVLAGIISCALGLFACITLHALCLLSGVLQIVVGFTMILLEAPCCCAYLDCIDKISKFSDERPPWQKAVLYCGLPIIPIIICQSVSGIVGNLLVFLCGLSFIYAALGKKASREEMLETARVDQTTDGRAGLVDNAQPIAQTKPPQYNNIV